MLVCSQSRWFCSIPFPLRLDVDEQASTTSEDESPTDDKIQPIMTIIEYESATDFKGFEALYNIVFDIDDQLLCSDVQARVGHMYDELRRLFEMSPWYVNKLALNVKRKKIHAYLANDTA